MTALAITKRIQTTNTGYTCYLNDTEVGTATTYSEAERVCTTAYETLTSAPASSAIRVQPILSDDTTDRTKYGKPVGISFFVGTGKDAIEVHVPNPSRNPRDVPCVYFADDRCIELDDLERMLPVLMMMLNDERVQKARAAHQRGA